MKTAAVVAVLAAVALCDPTRTDRKPKSGPDAPLPVPSEGPIPTVGPIETAVHLADLPTNHFEYVGSAQGGDGAKGSIKKQDDISEEDEAGGKSIKKASSGANGLAAVSMVALAGAVAACLL